MIIANCTATVFCDAAGVRRLVTCQARAAARGAQLRLVIPPGGLLRRLLELLGADSILPVYPSVGEASVLPVPAARDPLSLTLAGRPDSVPWAHCDNHGLGRRGTPFATLRNSNTTLRDGLG